jgi:hypothetical protein
MVISVDQFKAGCWEGGYKPFCKEGDKRVVWMNLNPENLKSAPLSPVVVRYVPPGHNPMNISRERAIRSDHIVYLGGLKCESQLRNDKWLWDKLDVRNDVWTDEAFEKLANNRTVFVNRHQTRCGTKRAGDRELPIEAFRVSQLLSAKALVVSVPSYHKDAREFKGMVVFEHNFFDPSWTRRTKKLVEDHKKQQRWLDASYSKFTEAFAPAQLFSKAGIFDDMLHGHLGAGSRD